MNKPVKTTDEAVTKKESWNGESGKQLAPIFVEAEKMFEKFAELSKETARRAYEFFERRGSEFGREFEDWFKAESEILRPVSVEVTEKDGNIYVTAAIPGFKPEEIEISVKDDQLIISGETEKREEKEDETIVYSDFSSNRFFRQMTLPSVVDADRVGADLKDGILTITLPKAAVQEAKRVAVTSG